MSTVTATPAAGAPTTAQIAVRLRDVKKHFGEGTALVHALRGIDLDVNAGQLTMLVGPSGCGKTTLISVIAGTLDSDSGEVNVLGSRLDSMDGRQKTHFRRANIGFVFQQYNLLPALTAAENVSIPLILAGVSNREAIARARDGLARVGLGDRTHSLPTELSGGQQQRVAIARSLVHEPRLLVCDEPTAALDGDTGNRVLEILREVALAPGRGVIIVTHDSRIFRFGDRFATMLDGHVIAVGDRPEGDHR